MTPYATITIEFFKSGLMCHCEDIDKEVFIQRGQDLEPLVNLINDAGICNPDTVFKITEKGRRTLKKQKGKEV